MSENRAMVFANGDLPDPALAGRLLRPDDFLVAADGGARHILALGRRPSVVVGDLDSLPEADRFDLIDAGVQFIHHETEKDETDLELAVQHAIDQGFRSILVVAGLGGRLDQTLGNIALLARRDVPGLSLRMDDGSVEAFFIENRAEIHGEVGDTVSLVPWGMPVSGIVTTGLKYALNDETLLPDRARGVSNVMTSTLAAVSVRSGRLLCIHERKSAG